MTIGCQAGAVAAHKKGNIMAATTAGPEPTTDAPADAVGSRNSEPRQEPAVSIVSPPRQAHRQNTPLARLLQRRWAGLAGMVVVAAGWGVVAGWWTPRGPITTLQALTAIAVSLGVGAFGGWWMRSRWAMLLTPVVFAAVFELTRASTVGPLVDAIRLGGGGSFGILAFLLGRGLHAILALLPMILGAALGAGVARRRNEGRQRTRGWARVGLVARRVTAGVAAVALLALTAGIMRPASTDPILTATGAPMTGSIAELIRVPIGGHDQTMMIRGTSTDNPVLLFLAGGPGGTELGAMRRHGQALENDFTVVTWDQRGTGRSYNSLDPTSTLTLQPAVRYTVEVSNYLRNRFGQDKIYLLGQSWGTILGVLAAQQHPELYRAYIGVGQMVDPRATDGVFYADTLAWARRTGNTALTHRLTAAGPPPYTDLLNYEPMLSNLEVYPYDHSHNAEGAGGFSENLSVKEFTLMDQAHAFAGFFDVFAVLYPQLQDMDFRQDAAKLAVPVYLMEGRFEPRGRLGPAKQWFELLDAPTKQWITFDTSGHRPLFEQPDLFHQQMVDTVLAHT
jgi:proline iminopeptidase